MLLVAARVFEIFIMIFGLAAFFSTRIELMLVVLFLMALHSTIFSPAKYGLVPEMLPDKDLSRANALLEMSTFVAIVLGTAIGAFLFSSWKNEAWKIGIVTLGVGFNGAVQDQSVRGSHHRHETFAAGTSAVVDGAGYLLFLVPGRAVSGG